MNNTKKCSNCDLEKELNVENFSWSNKSKGIYQSWCKICKAKHYQENKEEILKKCKEYRDNPENKERITDIKSKYYQENKEELNEYKAEWYQKNKKEILQERAQYREENREKIRESDRERGKLPENKVKKNKSEKRRQKERRLEDPVWAIMKDASRLVGKMMESLGASKNGISSKSKFPFTKNKLKEHLESQFLIWMTWINHGKYDSATWDDNDSSTWTWQVDHIIPHADLPYYSYDDPNFTKCWALSNLRPYSAKQNIIDGAKRIRHKK